MQNPNLHVKLLIDADGRAAVTEIGSVKTALSGIESGAQGAALGADDLARKILAIGAGAFALDGIVSSLAALTRTLGEIQGESKAFEAITGSAAGAQREMERTSAWADRLGLDIAKVRAQWIGLEGAVKGTALESGAAADVFDAVSESAARLGVSGPKAENALVAISQMASKGVISMEELRGQLSEAIPGAAVAMAKGLGISVAQLNALVETGTLTAEKALPALAKGLRDTFNLDQSARVETLNASIARLDNAFRDLKQEIGDAGATSGLTKLLDLAASLVQSADGAKILDGAIIAFGASLAYAVGAAGRYAAAMVAAREAQAAASREAQAAAASGLADAQSAETRARAHLNLATAAAAEARTYQELVVATAAAAVEGQAVARAQAEQTQAAHAAAMASKEAADAELLRLGSVEGQAIALANAEEFERRLTAAREASASATTSVAFAEKQLAIDTERVALADRAATESTSQLKAARAATAEATAARIAAEKGMQGALAGTAAAEAAAATAGLATAESWKGVFKAGGMLQAGMALWMGFEVGRTLEAWISSTDAYRHALNALGVEYGKVLELEKAKAERDAEAAPRLKQISEQTGVAVRTLADMNAAVERGALVWDKQLGQWVRGVEVAKGLKRGFADLDSQTVELVKRLEDVGKAQQDTARTAQMAADTEAEWARLAGDEAGALQILADARVKSVSAAREQLQIDSAELAAKRAALQSKLDEAKATGQATDATNARVAALTEEIAKQQRAVAADQAAVDAAKEAATAAAMAAKTYGDQSAQLGELAAQRQKAADELARLNAESTAGQAASAALGDAQKHLAYIQSALVAEMKLGGPQVQALAEAYRDQKLNVDLLAGAVQAGKAADEKAVAARDKLAQTTALAADAARDAAANAEREGQAIDRTATIAAARADVQIAELARRRELAAAEGDQARVAELTASMLRKEMQADKASSDAKRERAAALAKQADATEMAAKATGGYTEEEKAQVQALRDSAEMAGIEADRLKVSARAKRDALIATQDLAERQRVLREAFDRAGAQGVQSMDDVRQAISGAAKSDDLDALGRALEEAFQRGVLSAEEYQKTLDEILAKTRNLKDENRSKSAATDWEQVFAKYGTDIKRVENAFFTWNNPSYGSDMANAYLQWLDQQKAKATGTANESQTASEKYFARKYSAASGASDTGTAQPTQLAPVRNVRVELVNVGTLYGTEAEADAVVSGLERAKRRSILGTS